MKSKYEEAVEMLRSFCPHWDFDGMDALTNKSFDGNIHSVLELSTGDVFLSQGEKWSSDLDGIVVTIDRNMNFEELKPYEYDILEVLAWDEKTDNLEVAPYAGELSRGVRSTEKVVK